jgi:hypothetical protein
MQVAGGAHGVTRPTGRAGSPLQADSRALSSAHKRFSQHAESAEDSGHYNPRWHHFILDRGEDLLRVLASRKETLK